MLKFGVGLPNCREGLYFPPAFASVRDILQLAEAAESLGFSSVWVNDHFTAPQYVNALWTTPPQFFEPLITLSALTIVTQHVHLAIGVAILPIRNPVILAKQIATLDVFSGGRVILAVGLGAYREEFEKVHPTQIHVSRGVLLDEGLRALKTLFTQPKASFNGQLIQFRDIELYPKPVQSPFPIYIGGNASNVLKRVAEWGDGWLAAALTPSEIANGIVTIQEHAQHVNRDVAHVDIAPQFIVSIAKTRHDAVSLYHKTALQQHLYSLKDTTFRGRDEDSLTERALIGSPSDIVKQFDRLVQVGVTHPAALIFASESVKDMLDRMTLFSKQVIASFS